MCRCGGCTSSRRGIVSDRTRHTSTSAWAVLRLHGRFSINLTTAPNRRAAVQVFLGLLRGRFTGRHDCHSCRPHACEVQAAAPFALEIDGEVVMAHDANIDILPEQIGVCS